MASSVSLKSLIPALAPAFAMTPAALYERQRALVRAGLLKAQSGRGPGSGVKGTPKSLALLLISVLATESLSETELSTRRTAHLPAGDGHCPLTGEKTFARALKAILASPKMTAHIECIETVRGWANAWIQWYDWTMNETKVSPFQRPEWDERVLVVNASLQKPFPLLRIVNLIPETCEEWWRDHSTEEVERVLAPHYQDIDTDEHVDQLRVELFAEREGRL